MNCHIYLRSGTVYLPTMGKMDKGFYRGVDPVAVVSVSDTKELVQALQATIARGNPSVPMLPRGEIPPPVLLKYAGVRTWSAFEHGMMFWILEEENGRLQIARQSKEQDGQWRSDPKQKTSFSSGMPVDDVIEYTLAILQDAAR